MLPDSDGGSALTTALFTALPTLAAGDLNRLTTLLTQLRANADEARNVYGSPDENPAEALWPRSAKEPQPVMLAPQTRIAELWGTSRTTNRCAPSWPPLP